MLNTLNNHLQSLLSGWSPMVASLIGSALGLLTDLSGWSKSGNTPLFVALCAVCSALIASLPRLISARSHAKLSEAEFIGKETRALIERLTKKSDDHESILAITTAVRHDIQGGYQSAVSYIDLLKIIMTEHGLKEHIPSFSPLDVRQILRDMDVEIKAIKKVPAHPLGDVTEAFRAN